MESIFIGIPAYNEEDLHQTVRTALGKADNPGNVHIGISLHYPQKNFPDLSMFPNVQVFHIDEPMPIGISINRDAAASFYQGEEYFLQIDAHTIFKPMWDTILKANYKELKNTVDKPIISQYLPDWHRNKVTGEPTTMNMDKDWAHVRDGWAMVPKSQAPWRGTDEETYRFWAYGTEAIDSPYPLDVDYSKQPFHENYLMSGHFNFTSGKYLEEVPYDPQIIYHDENCTPLRAWTRGYRMFSMQHPPLWTRELTTRGRDIPNSWRSVYNHIQPDGTTFHDKLIGGLLRNKDILTGKIIGTWGAPSLEALAEYEKASKLDYKAFYADMYDFVEKTGDKYHAAKRLYDLDKKLNG